MYMYIYIYIYIYIHYWVLHQLGQLQRYVGVFLRLLLQSYYLKLVYIFNSRISYCIYESESRCSLELYFSFQETVVY